MLWDESCNRWRETVSTALNNLTMQQYTNIFSRESVVCIESLRTKGMCSFFGDQDINASPLLRFALNVSLATTYGFRTDDDSNSQLFLDILRTERTSLGIQGGYLFQILSRNKRAGETEAYWLTRNEHMAMLLDRLKANITQRKDEPCIIGNILKSSKESFTEGKT